MSYSCEAAAIPEENDFCTPMDKCNLAARVLLRELELALDGLQDMQREVERMGAGT
jgi:hypothetical protein